jgi:hypothetical protein
MEKAYKIILGGVQDARAEEKQSLQVTLEEHPIDIDIAGGLLSELYSLLQKHSMSARRKWTQLKENLYQSDLKEPIARFEEYMNRLDFKGAAEILKGIAERLGVKLK